MDIPIITPFIKGLRLFLASKHMRWLTVVFLLGLVCMSAVGAAALYIRQALGPSQAIVVFTVITGGIWPVFFLIASVLFLAGLQRYVASDESYRRSLVIFLPWMIVSAFCLLAFLLFLLDAFYILIFGVAFLGWIWFQAYFSTRTTLNYAEKVGATSVSGLIRFLAFGSNLLCYVAIFGALVYVLFTFGVVSLAGILLITLGTLLAAGFNFLNSIVMRRNKDKTNLINLALIGLFISLYSAYFIYNAGRPAAAGIDLVSISISLFFVFYTMSSIGRTLSSRAGLETRWKLSGELAAAFTFFLASGYYFADVLFPIIVTNPDFGASISDILRLLIFPFVALVMELVYLRRAGRVLRAAPEPETPAIQPETGVPKAVPEEYKPEPVPLDVSSPHEREVGAGKSGDNKAEPPRESNDQLGSQSESG